VENGLGLCTRLPNCKNELSLNMVIEVVAFHTFLHKKADRKQGIEWDGWENMRVVRKEEVILCRQCLLP
jgi:hypothetical protein